MKVTVKDAQGTVREYTFIMQCAVELFLSELPKGWELVSRAA